MTIISTTHAGQHYWYTFHNGQEHVAGARIEGELKGVSVFFGSP